MKSVRTFECVFFDGKKCSVKKKLNRKMLALVTFFLWVSPGLGDDRPPDCKAQDPAFCSSPCSYLKVRCYGNRDCNLDLCSFLFPQLPFQELERCWNLPLDCEDEIRYPTKRGILNKNVAYLLLKLHPFLNQTSQFGFLTSGRFRRITGNFGTEFLGKRFNNKPTGSPPSVGGDKHLPKPKPTPKFYSLPLDKFAKSKILKRDDSGRETDFFDSREKRLSIRGTGKVVTGSEFLGKRELYQSGKMMRYPGTELLRKRSEDPFDYTEFLGKREADTDFSGKTQHDPVSGTELLGKKSSLDSSMEIQEKRLGNELLGKRLAEKELSYKRNRQALIFGRRGPDFGFWFDYNPKLNEEASFRIPRIPAGSRFFRDYNPGICKA